MIAAAPAPLSLRASSSCPSVPGSLAATADYLFGYDATAGVVEDWVYEKLTETYVRDEQMREFFQRSSPWALHGIAERLLEAADRKLWDAPDPDTLAALRQAYLETEGDLEGR